MPPLPRPFPADTPGLSSRKTGARVRVGMCVRGLMNGCLCTMRGRDGGLYMPETVPDISLAELESWQV